MKRLLILAAILLGCLHTTIAQTEKPEIIWGYYMGAAFDGLGANQPGKFGMGIYVPGSKELKGSKVIGFWVPICTTDGYTKNLHIWGGAKPGSTLYFDKDCSDLPLTQGYNEVYLDEPFEIPAEGFYVGMTFDIPSIHNNFDNMPLGVVPGQSAGGLYLLENEKWVDYSTTMLGENTYVSAFELVLNDVNIPTHSADFVKATQSSVTTGGKARSTITLASTSYGVNSIDYTVECEGITTNGTAEVLPPMRPGFNRTGHVTIEFDAPTASGMHTANITITKVNGEPNESSAAKGTFPVSVVSRVVPRLSIVEENTGTGCGWCPRGWVGMEKVKENKADKAAVIAIHQYNSGDPMYPYGAYDNVPFSGAPQCTIDRRVFPEPYYGEGNEGIEATVDKFNAFLPEVAVSANAYYKDGKHESVVVEADTEFLCNGEGYSIAYVLTADELTGTSAAWKQTNYFATNYTAEELPADLAPFGMDGVWGDEKVALIYNDVMIGSSWQAGENLAAPFSGSCAEGAKQKTSYTIELPTRTPLRNALKYHKIYATVIVFTKEGLIANAARCRVLGNDNPDDIDPNPGDKNTYDALYAPVAEVQLMTEGISPSGRYIVGNNFAGHFPCIWDTQANTTTSYSQFEDGTLAGVNDAGVAVGTDNSYSGKAYIFRPGSEPEQLEGDETDEGAFATGISADGSVVCGYYFDAAWTTTPCIWKDGKRIALPLPSNSEVGFTVNGGEAKAISADGNVIAGVAFDDMSTWPAIVWRLNDKGEYICDPVCKDFFEPDMNMGKPYLYFEYNGLSANGEWLTVQVQPEYDCWDWKVVPPAKQAARLHLPTKKLEVLPAEEGLDYTPYGIANNGSCVIVTNPMGEEPQMIGRNGGYWAAGAEKAVMLGDMYTQDAQLQALANNSLVPSCISADAKYLAGFGIEGSDIVAFKLATTPNAAGIRPTLMDKPATTGRAYDLQGRAYEHQPKAGFYIQNGKKIIR